MDQTASINLSPYLADTAKGMISLEKSRQLSSSPFAADTVALEQRNPYLSRNHPTERKQSSPDWAFSHHETACMIQLLIW